MKLLQFGLQRVVQLLLVRHRVVVGVFVVLVTVRIYITKKTDCRFVFFFYFFSPCSHLRCKTRPQMEGENGIDMEPDMENDPTLASCCQREIRDRRILQNKLDHVRSGMPETLVNKSLITSSFESQNVQKPPSECDEHGAMTDAEIEAALNDDDFNAELEQLRLSRMQQLFQGNSATKKSVEKNTRIMAAVERGTLSTIPAEKLLDLAFTGQPIVALLTPGDQNQEVRKSNAPADDVAAGLARNMSGLAPEFVGSLFVTVAVHGT
jgi:predicted DNA-binding protein (UPF0251 family)